MKYWEIKAKEAIDYVYNTVRVTLVNRSEGMNGFRSGYNTSQNKLAAFSKQKEFFIKAATIKPTPYRLLSFCAMITKKYPVAQQ